MARPKRSSPTPNDDEPPIVPAAVRNAYQAVGVTGYYASHGDSYRNPHEPIIGELLGQFAAPLIAAGPRVLDLACGSGEVTLALRSIGEFQVTGLDPYTAAAYQARTGAEPLTLTFEQIAAGGLSTLRFDTVICSFALHLVEESRLPLLLHQLAEIASHLLVLTPHKRPDLRPQWGWRLSREVLHERVRGRLYERTPSDGN